MKKLKNISKNKIKSFKNFYKDEDETVFSGPGEEEARIKGNKMRKNIPQQPNVAGAPDLINNPGPNYTNGPGRPHRFKRTPRNKNMVNGVYQTDV